MKVHELKTDPDVFYESWCGNKPFEIRLNDRNFKVGDLLILRKTVIPGSEMAKGRPLIYSGGVLTVVVTSIVTGYGIQEGWVIMGVREIMRSDHD